MCRKNGREQYWLQVPIHSDFHIDEDVTLCAKVSKMDPFRDRHLQCIGRGRATQATQKTTVETRTSHQASSQDLFDFRQHCGVLEWPLPMSWWER